MLEMGGYEFLSTLDRASIRRPDPTLLPNMSEGLVYQVYDGYDSSHSLGLPRVHHLLRLPTLCLQGRPR